MAELTEAGRENDIARRQGIGERASQAPVPEEGKMNIFRLALLNTFFNSFNSPTESHANFEER